MECISGSDAYGLATEKSDLDIKAGKFEYDELVTMAEEKPQQLTQAFAKSDLPNMPNRNYINQLLVTLREGFYEEN